MDRIKHKVLVLSGKGGVGKSTVAVHMAQAMVEQGLRVGLLDVDLCGPSMPHMLGLDQSKIHQSSDGWVPVYTDASQRLAVVSIGFLLADKATAVVWRGPKKSATIRQFMEDVRWGDLDVLVIDTPPGTSDEHISVCEYLQAFSPDGAVVVTTPQGVALADVSKEISFCKNIHMPVLGLVENMSGFRCPTCAECTNIFASGGGEALAEQMDVPFLGRIPIDPLVSQCTEAGQNFFQVKPESDSLQCLRTFSASFAQSSATVQ